MLNHEIDVWKLLLVFTGKMSRKRATESDSILVYNFFIAHESWAMIVSEKFILKFDFSTTSYSTVKAVRHQ